MSSCKLKNNIERYANPPRTSYDQLFNKMYDPNSNNFRAAPWPMPRTEFDIKLQEEWCTCPLCCGQRSHPTQNVTMMPYTTNPPIVEGFKCGDRSNEVLSIEDPSNFSSYHKMSRQAMPHPMNLYMPTQHPMNLHMPTQHPMNLYTPTPQPMNLHMATSQPTNLNRKKGTFILCFAEWCGHCKKYMSTWAKFKEQNGNEYEFIEADMSDSKNILAPEKVKSVLKNIEGFPTILCVFGNNGKAEKIIHTIEKRDDIIQEIKSKFGNNTNSIL